MVSYQSANNVRVPQFLSGIKFPLIFQSDFCNIIPQALSFLSC